MSTPRPIAGGGLVTFSIEVNGSSIPDILMVHSIHVDKCINRIATANIVILDGSASSEKFTASSSDTFVPGNTISIEAGYEEQNAIIFKGLITGQSLRVDQEIGSALEVICKDTAIRLTVGRKSASFNQCTDSDVMNKLIGNCSGLSADVTSTSITLPVLQQHYSTDWDFILTRAEVNGLLVRTVNGKVSVFSPTENTTPVITVRYGDNILSFNAELNSVSQLADVKASAWDHKTQKLISGQAANSLAGPGNISSKKLSDVIGLSEFELQTTAAVDSENLSAWAKGQMLRSELAKIIGEVRIQGSSLLEPGDYISVEGMGDRFNGDHFVSAVRHDISEGNWFLNAGIGLSAGWYVQEPDVTAPPASGLLPGVRGLHNATVKKIHDDPDNEFRILVDLPLFDSGGEGLWARLSNFYSTRGAGAFFLPEVGDEVIVGFLNDDPRFPIILGSLYSNKIHPHSLLDLDENNRLKALVSKSGLRLVFDDEDKIVTLTTPGNNTLELNDEHEQIEIRDENENSIVMSSDGITIKSPKSINFEAGENVTIKGTIGVEVMAPGGDVTTSAMNITENADQQFSAQGDVTASVEGGAELTLKGAMVMIN